MIGMLMVIMRLLLAVLILRLNHLIVDSLRLLDSSLCTCSHFITCSCRVAMRIESTGAHMLHVWIINIVVREAAHSLLIRRAATSFVI